MVHWPIFVALSVSFIDGVPWYAAIFGLPLSIFIAVLQTKFVEQPFQEFDYPSKTVTTLVLIVITLAFSVTANYYRHSDSGATTIDTRPNIGLSALCDYENSVKIIKECMTTKSPNTLIWGDSYAMHLVPLIMEIDPKIELIQMTKSGCPPLLEAGIGKLDADARKCMQFNQSVLNELLSMSSIERVVLASSFRYAVQSNQFMKDQVDLIASSPETFQEKFSETVDYLVNRGFQVTVVNPPARENYNIAECLTRKAENLPLYGRKNCLILRKQSDFWFRDILPLIENIALRPRVEIFDLMKPLCDQDFCEVELNGINLYRDEGHLSINGAKELGNWLNSREGLP